MDETTLFLLQLAAGGFYFLNKAFLLSKLIVRDSKKRLQNILASVIYPFGLPFWIIIFNLEKDYIALSLEAGGIFSMILGIYTSIKGKSQKTKIFEKGCLVITILFILFGAIESINEYGGIKTLTQILEISIVTGFLVGTYYMAIQSKKVYFYFMFMNLSCATLMLIQGNPLLFWFQLASLVWMGMGYIITKKEINQSKEKTWLNT